MPKSESLSEFSLIEQIKAQFSTIDPAPCEGIGDDCAVIPLGATESMVVTTDLLVENIHFLREAIPPFALGSKALAVNLSDVAAMGATPFCSFLSLALPGDLPAAWIEEFMNGYHACSTRYQTALLGGDTTRSDGKLTISVTAIGRASNANIKRRSAAKSEDKIFVTGMLGDSAQGLLDIKSGITDSPFITAHYNPIPCVDEGAWLGGQSAVHAMMDLSDGLAGDLPHILNASNVSAEVSLDKIPTNTNIINAVTGGEDYQLLFTASAEEAPALCAAYAARFGKPLHEIGSVTTGAPAIRWLDHGIPTEPNWHGFTHF